MSAQPRACRLHQAGLVATGLLTSTGCFSGGIFTTARSVPPGAVEHLAALDMPVSLLDPPSQDGVAPVTRLGSSAGPQPLYGLRVGAFRRGELGGRLGPTSLELHGKLTLSDARALATALAPRVTAAGYFPGDAPYYARMPILLTFGRADGPTLTPRFGAGITLGAPKEPGRSLQRSTRDPFLESGVTLIVPVAAGVRVALEAYVLTAPREPETTGGLGFGLLLGRAVEVHVP